MLGNEGSAGSAFGSHCGASPSASQTALPLRSAQKSGSGEVSFSSGQVGRSQYRAISGCASSMTHRCSWSRPASTTVRFSFGAQTWCNVCFGRRLTGRAIGSVMGETPRHERLQVYVNLNDSYNIKSIEIDVMLYPNRPKSKGFPLKRSIAGDTTLVRVTSAVAVRPTSRMR